MIRITVHRADGRPNGLELEGHADLANAGSDILCAAVSTLAENLGNSLRILLALPAEVERRSGFYRVRVNAKILSRETDLLFQSTLMGLNSLKEEFRDRVELVDSTEGK